jgi:hypothetical protein
VTTASFSTSTLAGGTHSIQALYSGDSGFAGSSGTLSGGQVNNEVLPPSNPVFLTQVYQDLLHRAPDPGGMAAFSAALDRGVTRYQVVQAVVTSPEYRTDVVEGLYQTYFGRLADPSGLAIGVQFLNGGGTAEQLAAFLVSSPEYFQNRAGGTNAGFLNVLYRDALGRAIDPSGQTTYTNALAAGATRGQVAAAIFGSLEYFQDLVQSYYQSFLRRPADPSGLNTYVLDLLHGQPDEAVIVAIVGSPEYFLRL